MDDAKVLTGDSKPPSCHPENTEAKDGKATVDSAINHHICKSGSIENGCIGS